MKSELRVEFEGIESSERVIERIRKLEAKPEASDDGGFVPPTVAIAGSILGKVDAVREALTQTLRATYPAIQLMDAPADPVAGALWRARQELHPH